MIVPTVLIGSIGTRLDHLDTKDNYCGDCRRYRMASGCAALTVAVKLITESKGQYHRGNPVSLFHPRLFQTFL